MRKVNAILISEIVGMTLIGEHEVFGIILLSAKLLNRNPTWPILDLNSDLRGYRPKNNSPVHGNALNFMEPLLAVRMDSFGITNPEHKDSGISMIKEFGQIKSSSVKYVIVYVT